VLDKLTPMLAVAAVSAVAARPVATVTSGGAFTLGNVRVSATAVSSWPLTIGDELKELAADAVIRFPDNTQIAVGKGSSLKLEAEHGRTIVRLTSGTMIYRLGNNPTIEVYALDQQLNRPAEDVSINGQNVHHGRGGNGPVALPPVHPPQTPPGRSQGE
jgi:hypothetical protein